MAVTRIEGVSPLATAQSQTAPKQRVPADTKPHREESADTPEPVQEAKAPVRSNFKPYSLQFRFEKELNRVVVKVIDPETGEALREIPPESVIEALKQLKKAPGALVDEEV